MNQPKKNSIVAQASTELNSEAALKFLPLTSSKTGSTAGPTLKDEDGGPDGDILSYDIQVGLNGFFMTIVFSDAETPDARYILQTMDEVIELLRGTF